MKKLLVACILFCAMQTSYAQLVKVSVGIRGSGVAAVDDNVLKPSSFVQYGGNGGAFVGVKIGKFVGVQADALYSYRTAGYNISDDLTYKIGHTYVDVPVCFQLWLGRGFALEAGYQQSIALSGTIKTTDGGNMADEGILDYGSIVAGMVINMGKVVFLNLRYTKAIGYSYVMSTEPSKNMTLSLGLGFRIFNSRQSVFKK